MPIKIVLCGPPHSGKTCLREGLKRAILNKSLDYPYPYCMPATPDGDGAYYLPTVWADPNHAEEYRKLIKRKWESSPKFVEWTARSVRQCALPLVFIDIGGVADEKNRQICAGATHAIILGKQPQDFDEWRQFSASIPLTVIAEITSDFNAKEDVMGGVDRAGLLEGTVHYLHREESAEDRPVVKALADHVLRLTGTKSSRALRAPVAITPAAPSGDTLRLLTGFGRPAANPEIARAATQALDEILKDSSEFRTLLFDGPITVVTASALAWHAAKTGRIVGVRDPRLDHFVIVHSNETDSGSEARLQPGTVIDYGPVPRSPQRRALREDSRRIFIVERAGEQAGAARIAIRPGDEDTGAFELVPSALDQFADIEATTTGVLFDGRVPVIVASALACAAMPRFEYVAFFDPPLKRFVVAASKTSAKPVGTML